MRILQGKAVGRVISELSVKPKISLKILDDSETNTVGTYQLTQLQQPGEILSYDYTPDNTTTTTAVNTQCFVWKFFMRYI